MRDESRHGVVLHQEFAKLRSLGNEEIGGLAEAAGGEIDRADQIFSAGGDVEHILVAIDRERVELPGLSAIQQAETSGIGLYFFEIDDAGDADVLLDPGVFDGSWIDAVEAFGEVAEGAVAVLLHLHNVIDFALGENALFDEKLTDLDTLHPILLWGRSRTLKVREMPVNSD
jgi:hypothetical protein